MKICVYGASSNDIDKKYIEAGENLGKEMAKRGHSLIFGGGATGLMGAVARGVKRENGYVLGITPSFFNVDGVLFEEADEMIYTKTMSERKSLLQGKSDALIVTTGGFGTLDEFFEVVTLKQLSIHKKPIAILNTNGYYNNLLKMMDTAIKEGFMTAKNKKLFFVSDNPSEVLDYIENYKSNGDTIYDYKNFKLNNK
ncbi:MAG: TIGR00730 family Rossman fold protein [Clostridia bacterium]|nr:TIGR00730 family Rossman fold protein [Clostridia bacterium]